MNLREPSEGLGKLLTLSGTTPLKIFQIRIALRVFGLELPVEVYDGTMLGVSIIAGWGRGSF